MDRSGPPLTPYQQRLLPLLLDVVEANRSAVVHLSVVPPAPVRSGRWNDLRSARRLVVSGLLAVLLALGSVLLLQPAAAFAVERLPDGQIRMSLGSHFDDVEGLQRALRANGLDVDVVGYTDPGCEPGRLVSVAAEGTDITIFKNVGRGEFVVDPRALHGRVEIGVSIEGGSSEEAVPDTGPASPDEVNSPPSVGIVTAGCE